MTAEKLPEPQPPIDLSDSLLDDLIEVADACIAARATEKDAHLLLLTAPLLFRELRGRRRVMAAVDISDPPAHRFAAANVVPLLGPGERE